MGEELTSAEHEALHGAKHEDWSELLDASVGATLRIMEAATMDEETCTACLVQGAWATLTMNILIRVEEDSAGRVREEMLEFLNKKAPGLLARVQVEESGGGSA